MHWREYVEGHLSSEEQLTKLTRTLYLCTFKVLLLFLLLNLKMMGIVFNAAQKCNAQFLPYRFSDQEIQLKLSHKIG